MLQKGIGAVTSENFNIHAVGSGSRTCSFGLSGLSGLFGLFSLFGGSCPCDQLTEKQSRPSDQIDPIDQKDRACFNGF